MKALVFIVISIFLLSCATFEEERSVSLYKNYKLYVDTLITGDYESSVAMLALRNRHQFSISKNGESFNDFFPFFSSINTVIANEVNHYQYYFGLKGCLTVNGFNAVNEPASLNFELLNENNEWKFSSVQMIYHESENEFPSSAKCPPKPQGL